MEFDKLSNQVIGCALEVHKTLGPGLLESVYEQCLVRELTLAGMSFAVQEPLPIEYKGLNLDCGYRLDLLVDKQLIVELKSVESADSRSAVADIHETVRHFDRFASQLQHGFS